MGVRAAQHRDLQRAGREVVDVAPLAPQQPVVLDPLHLLAHHPRGHGASSPSVVEPVETAPSVERSSAARSTDATMFW
jgi:hypothetical protein